MDIPATLVTMKRVSNPLPYLLRRKLLPAALLLLLSTVAEADPWRQLDRGLELGTFTVEQAGGGNTITILRVDPRFWELRILSQEEFGHSGGLSAREWAKRHKLTAAINAGMYLSDHNTHAGYMKVDDRIESRHINRYRSLAAFSPYNGKEEPFRIFDLNDVDSDLRTLEKRYRYLLQNLRLIQRPSINRWDRQTKGWNEAALGEDRNGRALFIYSHTPLPMRRLNEALLALPIELVAAQHLEGGSEAQLYVQHNGFERELAGGLTPSFTNQQMNLGAWPIPNVIGIVPRKP